ncbi:hypothetical protein [Pseudoprimorskyibacter insulae]|uniref:Uncharacterized protein n=1 Tax=Pseudoprimorskyibacter insulae TaxID=1695997 RepID=A0A2R8AY26_9RHOB|nr:hypothetical protein [Pseudoprimorskyibacter insulae]SPF80926.1 hypothetical protein PRI8871_02739 [Pseudoprimorskyibacter insulae]
MHWDDVSELFAADGSLRDILVSGTTSADWDRMIHLASQLGTLSYQCDGQNAARPAMGDLLRDTDHAHCLKIDLGGPVAITHFLSADDIDLDIDPREIQTQDALDKVLTFCAQLGRALGRDVVITEENDTKAELLR